MKLQKSEVTANHDRMKLYRSRTVPAWVIKAQRELKGVEEQNVEEESEAKRYCLCRGPDYGFMIQCDLCEEWFHGACVRVTEEEADQIGEYSCPACARKC